MIALSMDWLEFALDMAGGAPGQAGAPISLIALGRILAGRGDALRIQFFGEKQLSALRYHKIAGVKFGGYLEALVAFSGSPRFQCNK